MTINAHLLPSTPIHGRYLAESIAVVIDVLRATTTIATALENGAAQVVTVREVEEARLYRAQGTNGRTVLGGERNSVRIEGFDLANSPLEYTPELVRGATVVLSTTNGTAAVEQVRSAQHLLCGSLRNAGAVARWIAASGCRNLLLLCAGAYGRLGAEDVIGAGAIIEELLHLGGTHNLDDGAQLARLAWLDARHDPVDAVRRADHGRTLSALGFDNDIEFCGGYDQCAVVPLLSETGFVSASPFSPAPMQGLANQQLER